MLGNDEIETEVAAEADDEFKTTNEQVSQKTVFYSFFV